MFVFVRIQTVGIRELTTTNLQKKLTILFVTGRMHDDMKKAVKEGTLQHTLMAAVNNDY